ncbi:hypothetical protein [Streptomyces sp. NPDC127108]|uniref:hypothetical protein n=1 Tax=Streptomyces sp. NPDC127108 TaxID=3345361 RepID=UPI00362C6524
MFAEPVVLRGLAAAAAASAVIGSVVMRQWDRSAGKRVAELGRARASDEWRYDERIAEAESDLEESRELRTKLEAKLRSKRAELAALRNEHAALLRRYATAETERASALEGRRLLAIEATTPTRALPPGAGADEGEAGASAEAGVSAEVEVAGAVDGAGGAASAAESGVAVSSVEVVDSGEAVSSAEVVDSGVAVDSGSSGEAADMAGSVQDSEPSGPSEDARVAVRPGASPTPSLYGRANDALDRLARARAEARPSVTAGGLDAADVADAADDDADVDGGDGPGKPVAADGHGHERAVAGHFAVPTAAAVVPPARTRRPAGEGGFDFFGTKSTSAKSVAPAALEAVQNEDLADVVGEEALAVHKAEAEAEFRPSDAATDAERGVGQVIDLTAHDETEQIDVEGLRTALRA